MGFDITSLDPHKNPGPDGFVADYDELMDWIEWLPCDYGWWCLGHNIETAAALATVRNLSWVRGWDAARTLAEFTGENVPRVTSG